MIKWTADAPYSVHFRLCTYVGEGSLHPSPFEGWATFTQIFQGRPAACRYAVAQCIPLLVSQRGIGGGITANYGEPINKFLAWDLLDDTLIKKSRGTAMIATPPPKWVGDSEDALVMKVVALYGKC